MQSIRPCGYSLLELLVTIAVAAIVFTLGIPSFDGLAADKRLRTESDALFHAVHLARKASVTRRRVITICPSADGETCSAAGDWSSGWMMFEEQGSSGTGIRQTGETVLQFHPVDPGVALSANRRSFSFRSTHLRATNGTLRLCDPGGRARSRRLVVSYTGRPRVEADKRSDPPADCATG